MSFVQILGVSHSYGKVGAVEALKDVSFDVGENEFVAVVGPSGCGKSTLLRLIADLLPLQMGTMTVEGLPSSIARRKRGIGFVFQEPALMPWRNSLKNARLPLEILRREADAGAYLNLVGLQDFGQKRPDQLSGGMRQRVSIARALTYDPPLLLMDEPFGSLDQITRDEMNEEFLRIWESKRFTVVFVTHSITEALYLSDRVVVLTARPGQIAGIFDVPFGRPRQPEEKRTTAFVEAEVEVLALLKGPGPGHG